MRHNKETQIINHLLETFSPKEFSNFNLYRELGVYKLTFETIDDFKNSNRRVKNLINFINENWYNIGNKDFEVIPVLIDKDIINENHDKVSDEEISDKISIINRKSYSNKIVFGNIYVHVKLEIKDGRLGRLKKFLKDLISSMINSFGYQFDEIYLDFTV